MQDERGGVASQQAAAPAAFQQAAGMKMPSRARFHVELKPGETTFVSWKKLIKEFHKAAPPSTDPPLGAHPALEARIAPDVPAQKDPLPPPPNRFNSVIEKIERIYKGDDSTDENDALNDLPDDDQYDTEDSFIDDRELNEYFSVDKAKLKHEGFFVNRGKLEWEAEVAASSEAVPKKRKRRDVKKLSLEAKPLDITLKSKTTARKNTLLAVGLSDSSDKELVVQSAPNKQATQKRKKEAQGSVARHDPGKAMERSICEHDQVIPGLGGTSIVQNNMDPAKGRELWKGDGVERLDIRSSPLNAGELHLIENSDSLKRDELKGTRVVSSSSTIKAKTASKSSSVETGREVVGVGGPKQKLSPTVGKEVSPVRPKGTAWERAFQDLERAVVEFCPPSLVSRDPEQGKRNRLPPDVKQKLGKVARLADKQGRLTDELIERLMGILGHVVRVKTLKRNMKEMIEMGLSAMQEKEGRVQDIKREVTEMVKLRVHSLQAQDMEERELLCDDFQPLGGSAEKPNSEGRYRWDHATEDKICDLYEQYIEGLEENRGPQIRKLYGELAELWPDGWMDNHGIKHAVQRAKERKKKQSKASDVKSESRKRQRPSAKQVDSEVVRFPLLDLNLPGSEHSAYDKGKSITPLQAQFQPNGASPVPLLTGVPNNHLVKKSKNFSIVEKKRSRMEGTPLLKKKVKRKLEKGAVDVVAHSKLMTAEYSLWKPGVQPLVALPARSSVQQRPLSQQQSKDSTADHVS